jgi:hypothetical protein
VSTRRIPRWAIAVAMIALLVVAAIIAGPPASEAPLDPASTARDGLRGVQELLQGTGAQVEVSLDPPVDTSTRGFVPLDRLPARDRETWLEWTRGGGTLVVADPGSPLHGLDPGAGAGLAGALGATPRLPACDLPALAAVGEVVHTGWRGFVVPTDGTGCFPVGDEGDAWLVVRPEGAGNVIALGSADPFTNGRLDRGDNAVLAAALLAPAPGDRVVLVPRPAVGEGDTTLLDLVPTRTWRGLSILLVALVLGVLWRSRRLGLPVADRLPPVVPAAELARSVAGLLQRARSRDGAAGQLRASARREVADRLGAATATTPDDLVDLVVARTAVERPIAHLGLVDAPVDDDRALVEVARAVAAVRHASETGLPSPQEGSR